MSNKNKEVGWIGGLAEDSYVGSVALFSCGELPLPSRIQKAPAERVCSYGWAGQLLG